MEDVQVLSLLLTARYVGAPAFNAISKDIDTLVNSTSGLSKVGAGLSLIGTGMTAAGIGLATFAVEAIKQASAYQDAVQRIISVHGIATSQVQSFNNAVMQTSDRFGQNSTDIANGLYYVTSTMDGLGYSIANNKAVAKEFFDYIVPAMGAMVAASGHGLPGSITWQQAGQDVVHIASAMNAPLNDWPTVMGDLTLVENKSGLTQQQLIAAALRAAPTARELGVNYSDLFAAIGATATAGGYGARAGTELGAGFRQMLTNKNAAAGLAKIGLKPSEFFGKNGQLIDTGTMLSMIDTGLLGVKDPQQRFALQQQIFGAVGNRTFGLLAQPKTLSMYQSLLSGESQNPVARMFGVADSQMSSFAGSVAKLVAAFQNFMKVVGGPLMNGIQPILDRLSGALNRLTTALATPAGAGIMQKLPGLILGGAAVGLTGGPLLQMGGGWLRDFAGKQDTLHMQGVDSLARYTERSGLGRAQLLATQDINRQSLLQRLQMAMSDASGVGGAMTPEALAKMERFDSPFMKEYNRQRVQYVMDQMKRTPTGQLSKTSGDAELRRKLTAYMRATPGTTGWGQTDNAARRYVDANWNKIAGQLGFDPASGPDKEALRKLYGPNGAPVGPSKAVQRLESQRKTFEQKAAQQLKTFDENAKLGMPSVEPSAGEKLVNDFLKKPAAGLWAFGQKFSPAHLGQMAFSAGREKLGGLNLHMPSIPHPSFKGLFGSGFSALGKAGEETAKEAGPGIIEKMNGHLVQFGAHLRTLPKDAVSGIAGGFGKLWGGIQNAGGGLMSFIKLIPGFLSFGSALLPIIAVVLLLVGAIVIAVLMFTRYRSSVMGLVAVFQSAFLPVFGFVKDVVMSVLKQIEDAWKSHSKEIDAAMKQLMVAIGYAAPFFQQIGFLIGAVISIIVKVIGYLVTAFIAALPFIIGVFTSIFRFLGDLGNIVTAILHGKWGMAWDYAKQALVDAWGIIKNLLLMLWTFISSVFSNLWKDISGPLGNLWSSITGWFSNLGSAIQNALIGALKGLGTALHNAVSNPVQSAINAIPGLGGAVSAGQALMHWAGHAAGGYVRSGEWSWVGEKGPERVYLPGGSRVYSHQDSMTMDHPLTGGGGSRQMALRIASLHVDSLSGLEGLTQPQSPAQQQRSPAEEYFYARGIQREREAIWDRYPNTSREFDHTYRKAYQYYG